MFFTLGPTHIRPNPSRDAAAGGYRPPLAGTFGRSDIGAAPARRLADEGAIVVETDVQVAAGQAVADALRRWGRLLP